MDDDLHFGIRDKRGGDSVLPWNLWIGTWHDGSKQADERMNLRCRQENARTSRRSAPVPAE